MIEIALTKVNLPTRAMVTWTSLVCALNLLPFAIIRGEPLLPAALASRGPLLGIGLLARGAGRSAIAYAFAHPSPQFTALATIIPAVAAEARLRARRAPSAPG